MVSFSSVAVVFSREAAEFARTCFSRSCELFLSAKGSETPVNAVAVVAASALRVIGEDSFVESSSRDDAAFSALAFAGFCILIAVLLTTACPSRVCKSRISASNSGRGNGAALALPSSLSSARLLGRFRTFGPDEGLGSKFTCGDKVSAFCEISSFFTPVKDCDGIVDSSLPGASFLNCLGNRMGAGFFASSSSSPSRMLCIPMSASWARN